MNLKQLIKEVEKMKKSFDFSDMTTLKGVEMTVEAVDNCLTLNSSIFNDDWLKLKKLLGLK